MFSNEILQVSASMTFHEQCFQVLQNSILLHTFFINVLYFTEESSLLLCILNFKFYFDLFFSHIIHPDCSFPSLPSSQSLPHLPSSPDPTSPWFFYPRKRFLNLPTTQSFPLTVKFYYSFRSCQCVPLMPTSHSLSSKEHGLLSKLANIFSLLCSLHNTLFSGLRTSLQLDAFSTLVCPLDPIPSALS